MALVNISTMAENKEIFNAAHDYSGMAMSVFVFFIWLFWEKRYAESYRLEAWNKVDKLDK